MHRRFAKAPWVELRVGTSVLRVVVAERFELRLKGLMGLDGDELEPLMFPRCRSVHTFGMRTPIDLVWLRESKDGLQIIGVVKGLPPRSFARVSRGEGGSSEVSALELRAGDAQLLDLAP